MAAAIFLVWWVCLQLLEQMPSVIVALDAHLDSAFQRFAILILEFQLLYLMIMIVNLVYILCSQVLSCQIHVRG